MIILHIEYTEETGYRRIYASDSETKIQKEWASGDPVKDWADMREELGGFHVMCSSDVDDFVCDVPGYRFTEDDRLVEDPDDERVS